MPNFLNKCKNFFYKDDVMTRKDYIILGLLVFIFSILVFFRIGNTYAPESSYITSTDNHDIIIDFGDYVTVEKLHVYLGPYNSRKLALSAFNEVTGAWEIINSECEAGSVFQWNDIDIYYKLRYLGIVATDEEAEFNEFVFTGPDGIVTPINTNAYPELFDEQDKFYNTFEHTYMDGTMFDEVYHGRTGYEFVHGLPTYETTHPQLGKCFIALGIKIFGMTPFGYRFFVALFGIFFIPLMYIFAKLLFKDTFVATCVGCLITFDCMHYTLSRIATIDIIVAFFIILTNYYMYKYIVNDIHYRTISKAHLSDKFPPKEVYMPLALCGVTMGCAIATKLTGVYAGVGLAVILIIHLIKYPPRKQTMRLFWFCALFFIVIPLVIYTLAYIPAVEKYAQMGHTDKTITWNENGLYIGYGWTGLIARTLRNTNYMINYHSNLEATHYYSSPFYQWPIIWKPLLAANNSVTSEDIKSSVSYMGNPAIWWLGIPCVLYTLFIAIKGLVISKKLNSISDKISYIDALFLTVAYAASYLPWFSVSRITFIYHYLPCAIITMLMTGYVIRDILNKKPTFKRWVILYLFIVIVVFIIFYPVISGLPVNTNYGMSLRWLPEWILVL